MEKFDVIVVGAGPSGNAAAYTLAKGGLKVLQLERGESPGTKNVQGAILYADALERIIPDFRDSAPLERHVAEQRMWLLDENQSCTGATYRDARFSQEPYNRYTILRARFDRWFSEKVKAAGALVICETTVKELLRGDQGEVIGVRTERAEGDILADCVILADGANALLGERARLRPKVRADDMALAVKEVLFLPKETIEARFNIAGTQGVVIEIAGNITHGMVGTGFLYTNKDSVSVGIGCMLSDMKKQSLTPYQLLEGLKQHPSVKPLIEGAEMKEYSAHLIPEGGYKALPQLYGDGWMVVGDSAGFVNAVHREGSNLAMTSGRFAAETLIELQQAGKPFTSGNLAAYKARLDGSFVMADLKKYEEVPALLHDNPHILGTYPRVLGDAARAILTVDGQPKRDKQKQVLAELKGKRSLLGLLGDAYKFWRAFR
ncbi:FAD-binding protein [Pseudothauera nasutitermitis]|uniref:Protein FixC n=1 Tax=Pseudothauera nasutitermitis TaxID=2565930 RepID=A0A4S4AP59_9RHOO|nr:FAD-dependent monooxygenase [Pseudothauera nasutitermitis]THF61449.1 FAD-binding protein [Pseudothauera nasutitermitis]